MGKQVSGNLLKLAILLIALQEVGAGAATPALGAIAAAFPDVSPTIIQNISTLPALFIVIFSVLYGFMAKVMRKRSILYLAVALFLIGGIVPAFLDNIFVILVFRAMVGAGIGLLYPMSNDLIVDFFEGDTRKKMIGYAFAVGMLGGIFFQMVGGALSDINWHYTFFAYAISIIFFIIPLIFLPEPSKKTAVAKGTAQESTKVPIRQYVLCILCLLWAICFTAIVANGAMVVVGENIGTGAHVGMLFSLMTLAGFFGGLFFARLAKILKSFSLLFTYWCVAIGMFIFYAGHSLGVLIVAMCIIGIGLGYAGSNFFNKSTDIVPFAATTMAISLIFAFNSIGQFISPFVMNPLVTALGLTPGRAAILTGALGLVVLGIISFFFDRATPKIPESEKPQAQTLADSEMGNQQIQA